ncbi:MAG: hypothetical protein HOI70_09260 [Opitutae bacterium]|nr:hypothetical protein [Opitutae bacterium]
MSIRLFVPSALLVICSFMSFQGDSIAADVKKVKVESYAWTTDHMHIGVRWQPFGLEECDRYDANRPLISEHSSYAQFWVSWNAAEPTAKHTDYNKNMSGYLKAIENAVDACIARGVKTELVMWHCPGWASESGKSGAWKPRIGEYPQFTKRMAKHFKGRVDAFQLYHEVNLQGMMNEADMNFIIKEVFTNGGKAIREVYDADPKTPVIVSTSGTSPCQPCGARKGLKGVGAVAVDDYYRQLVADKEMMKVVDALNLNISDHANGYGMMDGKLIPNCWTQYDLARAKLDKANYFSKKILSAESWIVWDSSGNNHDVNGDGLKNEVDAFEKTVTIFGKVLERGLNTVNMPWCDNSSRWSMGLVKRVDYNGRVKELKPEWVIPSNDGGSDIVTRKIGLRGGTDNTFQPVEMPKSGLPFTVKDYINPGDPNHLHYYIWRWYSQIAGGSDEVIRHAIKGERGNDIIVSGSGMTGNEQYKISSYNRTKDSFTVLIYSGGANGKGVLEVAIPSTIQNGVHYNNDHSNTDFRGEGFREGTKYNGKIVTKDISRKDGSDQNSKTLIVASAIVSNGVLKAKVSGARKFTVIEFTR